MKIVHTLYFAKQDFTHSVGGIGKVFIPIIWYNTRMKHGRGGGLVKRGLLSPERGGPARLHIEYRYTHSSEGG